MTIVLPTQVQPGAAADVESLLKEYRMRKIFRGPDETIPPKAIMTVLNRFVEGFLAFVYLKTNNGNLEVVVDLYGDGTADIVLSPRQLCEEGFIAPSTGAAWLAKWPSGCPETGTYVAVYTPSPWIPWRGMARVFLRNNSMYEARFTMIAWIYERVAGQG